MEWHVVMYINIYRIKTPKQDPCTRNRTKNWTTYINRIKQCTDKKLQHKQTTALSMKEIVFILVFDDRTMHRINSIKLTVQVQIYNSAAHCITPHLSECVIEVTMNNDKVPLTFNDSIIIPKLYLPR
jgi:hypothetical protein